jgi:Tol biopolymer transport system component
MTNKRFRMTLMLIGALTTGMATMTFGVSARQATAPDVLLGQAQHQQDVDGNFDAAIATYKKVIADPRANRALVAKALLLMGACYEQLGNAEANRAYERIVKEFSDLSDTASAARARLASLNAGPRAPSSGLAMRRIYDGPGLDWCNGLSSNARYLSYPDWSTGDIGVADLTTGVVRRVTANGTINQSQGEFGECTAFSPGDRQIAFFWQAKDGAAELRTVGLDGSGLRTVYRDAERTYLRPLDWSADGRSVLVELYEKSGGRIITVVSMSDGALRVLKHGNGGNSSAQFSPDGRFVAYSSRSSADSSKQDLSMMAADGGGDIVLISHPADDVLLGWAPDGKTVFFASDRMGSYGVWSIGVLNGRPEGAPALVKADVGAIIPVRMLNGTLYYQMRSSLSDIYIAPVDPAAGKLLSKAAPIKPYSSGPDSAADWSPDGKSLAYRSIRSGTADPTAAPALVSIFTLDTGQERQIRPALEGLDFNDGPHWSPDGRSLLVIAKQVTPGHGVHRVDVETGATTPLVKAPPDQYLLHAVWGRDGQSVFYTIGPPTRIVRRDLATGKDTELVSLPTTPAGIPRIALSPDGRSLAFTTREAGVKPATLNLVPADGGTAREIYRAAEQGEGISALMWTPDGRYLFFRKMIPSASGQNAPSRSEFWRATPDGRVVEKTDLDPKGNWYAFSPDGRRVAFTTGQGKTELWALENLAPRKIR